MLLRLAYLGITNTFALLRLLLVVEQNVYDKDDPVLSLRENHSPKPDRLFWQLFCAFTAPRRPSPHLQGPVELLNQPLRAASGVGDHGKRPVEIAVPAPP